jgi:ribosomal protein S27E
MKDNNLKSYLYNCNCGYVLRVQLDFGVPQEYYKCRRCGKTVQRKES